MECVICKNGTNHPNTVTFTLERDGMMVIFKNVPALVCSNCGDFYLTPGTTRLLMEKAEAALQRGVEIEIINLKQVA